MSEPVDPIIAERASRDAAKAALTGRYRQLRQGLADKGIGKRIADDAKGKAMAVAKEATEIASDNRGIIAATIATLALWAFRKPLLEQAQKWAPRAPAAVSNLFDKIRDSFVAEPDVRQEEQT